MVKKAILNRLINNHDISIVEKHLIYNYLHNNDLDYTDSEILSNYFKDFEQDVRLFFDISTFEIETIKDLESHLELLIPSNDRKVNGAFFTPHYIIDFIINEIGPQKNDKNLDPSCGCGAFLIGLIDYYKRTFLKPVKATVRENIFGSDILDYNIHRCRLLLSVYALQQNEFLEERDFNLYSQDSLKANWNTSFDNVLGNPPYVKVQDLSDENSPRGLLTTSEILLSIAALISCSVLKIFTFK